MSTRAGGTSPQGAGDGGTTTPVLAVVGPTGTGKSDLGVALAGELGGEVINADALQLYRGMDIGTAKLSWEQRGGVPHHLLDVLEVTEAASVAWFQVEARQRVEQVLSRGRVPVLVGGSGLYVRAVLDTLEFPGTDPAVRRRLEQELAESGVSSLRRRLREVDPSAAERIADDRRLIRALEVYEITGRPFSVFLPRREYHRPAVQIGLDRDRQLLREHLTERVHRMFDEGLVEEVRSLIPLGLREGTTARHALGYHQILEHLEGRITREEAVAQTIAATHRFAKRQRTWFGADPRVRWLDSSADGSQLLEQALETVRAASGRTADASRSC